MIDFCHVSIQGLIGKTVPVIAKWNKPEFVLDLRVYSGPQIQFEKSNNDGWGRCNFLDKTIFIECLGGHEMWCLHAFCLDQVDLFVLISRDEQVVESLW